MGKPFNTREDNFIRENYLTMSMQEISRRLKRSRSAARQRAPKIGCIVPPEIREHFSKMHRVKKGNIPFNKGKKQTDFLTPEAIAKSVSTRFKKGDRSHNSKQTGEITKRKDSSRGAGEYYYIKLETGKLAPLHRHVWEKANGQIEKGMKIAFRDGNTSNCTLENLELVTAAEMMRRNTIHAQYPKDLCLSIQLNGAMKRKINNKIKTISNDKT